MATEDSRTESDDVDDTGSRREGSLTPAGRDSLTHWVLISGNRWVVTALVLLLVALGFVALGTVWTDEIASLFTETGVVETLLITLLSGIILLVSIAVSVNAVVLSQEITALGEQEEQIEETFAFRDSIRSGPTPARARPGPRRSSRSSSRPYARRRWNFARASATRIRRSGTAQKSSSMTW